MNNGYFNAICEGLVAVPSVISESPVIRGKRHQQRL